MDKPHLADLPVSLIPLAQMTSRVFPAPKNNLDDSCFPRFRQEESPAFPLGGNPQIIGH